jgi:hypothetical protein
MSFIFLEKICVPSSNQGSIYNVLPTKYCINVFSKYQTNLQCSSNDKNTLNKKKKGGYFCLIEQNLLALSSFCLTKEVHCKYFVVWEILMQFSVQGTLQIDS